MVLPVQAGRHIIGDLHNRRLGTVTTAATTAASPAISVGIGHVLGNDVILVGLLIIPATCLIVAVGSVACGRNLTQLGLNALAGVNVLSGQILNNRVVAAGGVGVPLTILHDESSLVLPRIGIIVRLVSVLTILIGLASFVQIIILVDYGVGRGKGSSTYWDFIPVANRIFSLAGDIDVIAGDAIRINLIERKNHIFQQGAMYTA